MVFLMNHLLCKVDCPDVVLGEEGEVSHSNPGLRCILCSRH